MVEPIHAPVFDMENLFPIAEGKAQVRQECEGGSAIAGGAQEMAKKTKWRWGTVTAAVPPLFPLKACSRNRSDRHAAWSANVPQLPQTIPQASSGHRESSPTKPRRRVPGLGQNADDSASGGTWLTPATTR